MNAAKTDSRRGLFAILTDKACRTAVHFPIAKSISHMVRLYLSLSVNGEPHTPPRSIETFNRCLKQKIAAGDSSIINL